MCSVYVYAYSAEYAYILNNIHAYSAQSAKILMNSILISSKYDVLNIN